MGESDPDQNLDRIRLRHLWRHGIVRNKQSLDADLTRDRVLRRCRHKRSRHSWPGGGRDGLSAARLDDAGVAESVEPPRPVGIRNSDQDFLERLGHAAAGVGAGGERPLGPSEGEL